MSEQDIKNGNLVSESELNKRDFGVNGTNKKLVFTYYF